MLSPKLLQRHKQSKRKLRQMHLLPDKLSNVQKQKQKQLKRKLKLKPKLLDCLQIKMSVTLSQSNRKQKGNLNSKLNKISRLPTANSRNLRGNEPKN